MTPVIVTEGLTKVYGRTRAVDDLSLEIPAGQVFGFLGPNGAGKSTTIRLLLALQRPTAGRARMLGLDAWSDSVEIHRRTGYLPGELALYPRLTARQHFEWFGRARGRPRPALVTELVDRFEVVTDRPARELSRGNRQKVGLVLAFMHQPELVVLDEPTTGLDPLMQNRFEQLVHETVGEGRTVFLSSHELGEVQRLADRVAVIRDGRLVATDTVEHLRAAAPKRIEARFSGPVERSAFRGVPGVSVAEWGPDRIALEVTGPIGPVLRQIAEHDPVDVVSRHADLDDLFLEFYRPDSRPEVRDGA